SANSASCAVTGASGRIVDCMFIAYLLRQRPIIAAQGSDGHREPHSVGKITVVTKFRPAAHHR
ncbi:MAG: hypothetical protein AAF334_10175, partial [Pseudomonadota bacterium]